MLWLSKAFRDVLREALVDAEMSITQVSLSIPDEEQQSPQISILSTHISFNPEDMQVLGKHDRPLYFTSYLGSANVNRILVDPGFALSIMSHQVMLYMGIPTSPLSSTNTKTYGFNANGTFSLGKIRLKR